jgi:hypothetical protein
MTQRNRSAGEHNAGEGGTSAKKPYKKPEFRHEKVFETMALACGKVHPTQGQCRFNRKRS